LIISLVNNFEDYGGRKKYVEWAGLDEPDEFYTDSAVKQFYKNHVKVSINMRIKPIYYLQKYQLNLISRDHHM